MGRFARVALWLLGCGLLAGCQGLGVGREGQRCNAEDQCLPGLVCDQTRTCVRPDGGDGGLDGADTDGLDQDAGLDGDARLDAGADDGGAADGDPAPGDGDGDQGPDDEPAQPVLTETWAKAWEGLTINERDPSSLRLALTGDGQLVLAGEYDYDFDFDPSDSEPADRTGTDIFIAKFDRDGIFGWARSFGSQGSQNLLALAVDTSGAGSTGNYYIGGYFEGTLDFSKYGAGGIAACSADGVDAYLASLSADGEVRWVRCWGGPGTQVVTALAPAPDNSVVYAAGYFSTALEGEDVGYEAGSDGFVLGLDPSTGETTRATSIGGPTHEYPIALAISPDGEWIYLAGTYLGLIQKVDGQTACYGFPLSNVTWTGFLMKLGSSLDATCEWGLALGDVEGLEPTQVRDLLCTGDGDLWLTGEYQGQIQVFAQGLDPAPTLGVSRSEDAWLAHFTSAGEHAWWDAFGAASRQRGLALAGAELGEPPDPASVLWTGWFDQEIDFGAGPLTTPANQGDAFLSIFDTDHHQVWSRALAGDQIQEGRDVVATADGAVFIAGTSTGQLTLAGQTFYSPHSEELIFLVRFDPPGD